MWRNRGRRLARKRTDFLSVFTRNDHWIRSNPFLNKPFKALLSIFCRLSASPLSLAKTLSPMMLNLDAIVKNSILCTSMITGYAQNGRASDGLELSESLVMEEDFVPDHICFTAVLIACNHAGFLSRAIVYFDKMRRDYSLVPQLDQYACLVDLYARSGLLKKCPLLA
ncbi:hypothetical protein RJ640_008947 [Escallonia rubra]|uniref:Pentatricopeptide repeat-containing protein n=1 Tax=Escallonia rubra TaxID=112253 RepID=A0AA88RRF2_9ASTE|nr:hypothetical protein RJ640_008947 [Escallonia rubra]